MVRVGSSLARFKIGGCLLRRLIETSSLFSQDSCWAPRILQCGRVAYPTTLAGDCTGRQRGNRPQFAADRAQRMRRICPLSWPFLPPGAVVHDQSFLD